MKTKPKKSVTFIALSLCLVLCSCNYKQDIEVETIPKDIENDTTAIYENEHTEAPFIVNRRTLKFHYPECYYAYIMNDENKIYFYGSFEEAEAKGYSHCYYCGE